MSTDFGPSGEATGTSSDVSMDSDTQGLIQYGEIQQPGFYGNQELKNSNVAFNNAINTARAFAGVASYLMNTSTPTNYTRTNNNYILTTAEKNAIDKKSMQLSLIGIVPYDHLHLFFYILASIDNINDLTYIAQVVGIPELADKRYIKNIIGVIGIQDIYKVGFLANAVASIDKQFAPQFQNARNYSDPKNSSFNNVLQAISAVSSLAEVIGRPGGYAIGGYMSELITGTRVPTSKQANNPMLSGPSYAGKAFFGETPVTLPAVDQMFCRRVASFGTVNGGAGTSSFGMQNFNSFGGSQSITSMVAKVVLNSGVLPPETSAMGRQLLSLTNNVCNILNVNKNTKIEMRRSDNSIPFMIGMSAVLANDTHTPFGTKVFSEGWKLASSTSNDVQKSNPQYLEVCKTSL
ncbi:hypothetical protein UFOVP245_123 [uncultured Caudovirales phage]|uniref:Uncharacterized protein n=1 Tax=uncultured Caudovirales phage TaxID=2100421 RepID=A0A6J7WTJ3_9CAUD|nr:hypothetical protein UFOVP245_123 [uncultured Caudovirales phage]